MLISTCNRMELYLAAAGGPPQADHVINFIGEFHGLKRADFAEHLYAHEEAEAVRHLFQVVCSLDSMVLGESQILAQSKQGPGGSPPGPGHRQGA